MTRALPSISDALLTDILKHADSEKDKEVGGILVGEISSEGTRVEAILPALKAEGERANVTFTHDVWNDALGEIDRRFPTLRIVGWYHSHPGFGIFLSNYDEFIHKNFFSEAGMVALVVDPQSNERGWFGWEKSEVIRLDEPESVARATNVAPQSSFNRYAAAAGILLLGALGGWIARGELASTDQVPPGQPSAETRDATPSPRVQVVEYTVGKAATLKSIVKKENGNLELLNLAIQLNPGINPEQKLKPGKTVQLPVKWTDRPKVRP